METSEVKILIYVVRFVLLILGLFILLFFVSYKSKQRGHKKKIKELDEELLRTQLEIQEQTFKTISQEIHDNIGQMLSLAKLNLNTIDLSKEEKAAEKIGDARQLVSKAIQDLRDLSKTLNTDTIAATGLLKAIEMELHLLQKTGSVQTHFTVSGTTVKADPQKELILFRIVQEALHNVIKHAQAARVVVSASFEKEQLQITVSDDGCGFDRGERDYDTSGLRNMLSRSKLIGAALSINSRRGDGTEITITLPLKTEYGTSGFGR